MAYRHIKRVLGEGSLEWKSRFLFGACLVVLVGGAFWSAERIAVRAARDATREKAQYLVDVTVLLQHAGTWRIGIDEATRDFARRLSERMIEKRKYRHEILHLTPSSIQDLNSRGPADPEERRLLEEIKRKYDAWIAEQKREREELRKNDGKKLLTPTDNVPRRPPEPIFAERVTVGKKRYYNYYQPVYWHKLCHHCHEIKTSELGTAAAAAAPLDPAEQEAQRFRVVKVSLDYDEIQYNIDKARALLVGIGILTVFLAMVALYVIFRYVVIKPLQHLREVSELVSRGQTSTRAEIRTGDEFQQLAESFNRMLRHLTEAQQELQHVNEELDAKVDELARLNLKLHEMNRMKSEFISNMSHELRTPLNSIIGFANVLKDNPSLDPKQKKYAQNIEKSGRVLLEMINDILDLAKMEAGKTEVRPTEFAIDKVVLAQCDVVRSLSEQKGIDLVVDVDPELEPLYQDQAKIQQILTNLLSNAIKFTPDGGRVVVSAGRTGTGDLILKVADTGVGIPEEDRERIFEKFRQSSVVAGEDGLTREFSGTGLGLSIVREICELLGGSVDFESEVGKGTTFYVVLPWRYRETEDSVMIGAAGDHEE
ncbi:MAG TPA: HAMP domain-containing protein [Planctomycetaceae bacterium]|nr:HAMP domain-containing protein [Planctomycetaceae bacterium]